MCGPVFKSIQFHRPLAAWAVVAAVWLSSGNRAEAGLIVPWTNDGSCAVDESGSKNVGQMESDARRDQGEHNREQPNSVHFLTGLLNPGGASAPQSQSSVLTMQFVSAITISAPIETLTVSAARYAREGTPSLPQAAMDGLFRPPREVVG